MDDIRCSELCYDCILKEVYNERVRLAIATEACPIAILLWWNCNKILAHSWGL